MQEYAQDKEKFEENKMSVNKDGKTVLKIGELRDIRYEGVKEFPQSISKDAYRKAVKITTEIVRDNTNLYRGSDASGTARRNLEQIYNIIFFTGNRGSGKTSTMLSYMEYLKDYYRLASNKQIDLKVYGFELDANYMFTGLEYIDASSLDDKEDILGSVLSKMLKKWEEEEARNGIGNGILKKADYAYSKRQMYMLFSQVYESLKNLRSSEDPTKDDSDAFMETLQNLSLTHNLRVAFQQLVEKYLDIMSYPGTDGKINNTNHFLVISIDDLDMNIENGFRLLEEIRRYFMIPNVIVLLSANYEQLEKICLNHYMAKFDRIRNEYGMSQYISSLAREYLEKMVPSRRQICMESGKAWKIYNERKILIQHKDHEDNISENVAGETLEEIVKKKMENILGAQFLLGEKCLFYLSPDTVRELCVWLNHMELIQEEMSVETGEEKNEVQKKEYLWFENEEFPRLCRKYLEAKDRNIFEDLESLAPGEQMRYATNYLQKTFNLDKNCSFLETLATLMKRGVYEQGLVSLLNIYFTIKLSKLHTQMRSTDRELAQESQKEFWKYFQDGIWGEWERKMVGLLQKGPDKEAVTTYDWCYYSFAEIRDGLNLSFSEKNFEAIENSTEKVLDILKTSDMTEWLKDYQCVLLFFDLHIDANRREKYIWKLEGHTFNINKNYSGVFRLSNPIMNLIKEDSLAKEFLKELPDILYEEVERHTHEGKDMTQDYRKKIEKYIKKQISICTDEDTKMPIDCLEFLLLTGERLYSSMNKNFVVEQDIGQTVCQYYEILQEAIRKLDVKKAEDFGKTKFVNRIMNSANTELARRLKYSITASIKPVDIPND